jgi:hypothetical protein
MGTNLSDAESNLELSRPDSAYMMPGYKSGSRDNGKAPPFALPSQSQEPDENPLFESGEFRIATPERLVDFANH